MIGRQPFKKSGGWGEHDVLKAKQVSFTVSNTIENAHKMKTKNRPLESTGADHWQPRQECFSEMIGTRAKSEWVERRMDDDLDNTFELREIEGY